MKISTDPNCVLNINNSQPKKVANEINEKVTADYWKSYYIVFFLTN